MSKAIAFFPWIAITEAQSFGPLRLLPYKVGKAPGDLPHATQTDIDAVLGSYAEHPGRAVRAATLVEFGDWRTGMDIEDRWQGLWASREFVAFAALAKRRLFTVAYTNTDAYKLVIQRYVEADARRFAFRTRRRDGYGQQLWSSDEFAFHRPSHVGDSWFHIDDYLLRALMQMPEIPMRWRKAIEDYCAANTDSPDMPEHTEAVLMLCAFEWLFKFKHANEEDFVKALQKTFPDIPTLLTGPLNEAWQRYRKKRHTEAIRPLEAWAREFCQVRGQSAHGQSRDASRFVWPLRSHLAFASMLFPLAFTKVLADAGHYPLSEADAHRIRQIDAYVLNDPFVFDHSKETKDNKHPWCKIDSDGAVRALIEQSMREVMAREGPIA